MKKIVLLSLKRFFVSIGAVVVTIIVASLCKWNVAIIMHLISFSSIVLAALCFKPTERAMNPLGYKDYYSETDYENSSPYKSEDLVYSVSVIILMFFSAFYLTSIFYLFVF